MPRKREPKTNDRLTMLGPGRKWHSAKVSLNCSAVIQRCSSTIARRANTSTPPKPDNDIFANARNSVITLGGSARRSGAGTAAGTESEAISRIESGGHLQTLGRQNDASHPISAKTTNPPTFLSTDSPP